MNPDMDPTGTKEGDDASSRVIRLFLVDDHPIVRSGLRTVLDDHSDLRVVGDAATGEDAVELLSHTFVDVVLCDLRLGEGMDGVATTRALRALNSGLVVLVLTTFDKDADLLAAVEAGASGYLLKDSDPSEILLAVRTVASGREYFAPDVASRVVRGLRNPAPELSDRELEVLRLVGRGYTNKDVAAALVVTEATVKSHLVHVFTKLDVASRSRAVHVARERGLID